MRQNWKREGIVYYQKRIFHNHNKFILYKMNLKTLQFRYSARCSIFVQQHYLER